MVIKNFNKISDLVPLEMHNDLDRGANLHLRHSNIEFKVIVADDQNVQIRVTQGKSAAENYAKAGELIALTRDLFKRFLPNHLIHVHPSVYVPSPSEVVDANWINSHMLAYGVKVKDISFQTGLDKTNISAWINDKRPMSQIVKALMFNFFKIYAIKQLVEVLSSTNPYDFPFQIKTYFDKDLIYKLALTIKPACIITEDGEYYKIDIVRK